MTTSNVKAKPATARQGLVVIERDSGVFLVMFPTGDIVSAANKRDAERKAKVWFRKHANNDKINVGTIEWRL